MGNYYVTFLFSVLKKVIVFLRREYDGLDAFVKDKQL